MWPGRIAFVIVLLFSAACLTLAGIVVFNFNSVESPERYLMLVLGLAMLYMGGSALAGLIWPPKKKDPDAPVEIPPLHEVRGRTSYRDSSPMAIYAMLSIGAIFLAVSLSAAAEQPVVLVISLIAVGVLAGAGVQIRRLIRYGRARLELAGPARRGDMMTGAITTSGSAWAEEESGLDATVELSVLESFSSVGHSRSVVRSASYVDAIVTRDGNAMTFRFSISIPVIDTGEGRFTWNIQLETQVPKYRATFVVDVA